MAIGRPEGMRAADPGPDQPVSPGSGLELVPLGAHPGATLVRRRITRRPSPAHDETLATARQVATAFAHRAKAKNTRMAYRAGVRAWCAWCAQHDLPALPARAADVAAFLAYERRRGMAANTVELRRAAIRYLHFIAGCPIPTADAQTAATMAGIHGTPRTAARRRTRGKRPDHRDRQSSG